MINSKMWLDAVARRGNDDAAYENALNDYAVTTNTPQAEIEFLSELLEAFGEGHVGESKLHTLTTNCDTKIDDSLVITSELKQVILRKLSHFLTYHRQAIQWLWQQNPTDQEITHVRTVKQICCWLAQLREAHIGPNSLIEKCFSDTAKMSLLEIHHSFDCLLQKITKGLH